MMMMMINANNDKLEILHLSVLQDLCGTAAASVPFNSHWLQLFSSR